MKRKLFILLAAVAVLSSCSRTPAGQKEGETGDVLVCFGAGLADAPTKSEDIDPRDHIESLTALVFDWESGEIVHYQKFNGSEAWLTLRKGLQHDIRFVANCSDERLADVKDLSELLLLESSLEDSQDLYVMTGKAAGSFVADTKVDVVLSRLCSRITISNITPVFWNEALNVHEVRITKVYLTEVCGGISYFGDITGNGPWYYRAGIGEDIDPLLLGMFHKDLNILVDSDEPHSLDLSLLCYSGDVIGKATSQTRLVIESTILGETGYYAVDLPALAPNNEYLIDNIRLLGFGSGSPDGEYDRNQVSFNIEINSWGESSRDIVME
ncbi:MAG: hypothetical protein IJ504_01260 [Bacteroidales bacterium]|nr:hypothetical protein [Bacteroidales bacterium]